ncbi:hypothetical protein RDI58_015209 [Solanum bulbocastanum]|uniref:Uncharacterized protein n=1 Tax=Solanum bulbocastanum TaxID=147425 RepID=A0AAN8YBE1_SOLBU
MQKHREDTFSLTAALTESPSGMIRMLVALTYTTPMIIASKTRPLGFTWNIINSSRTVNGFITWKDLLPFCL